MHLFAEIKNIDYLIDVFDRKKFSLMVADTKAIPEGKQILLKYRLNYWLNYRIPGMIPSISTFYMLSNELCQTICKLLVLKNKMNYFIVGSKPFLN
jgi:hypothetical protein